MRNLYSLKRFYLAVTRCKALKFRLYSIARTPDIWSASNFFWMWLIASVEKVELESWAFARNRRRRHFRQP